MGICSVGNEELGYRPHFRHGFVISPPHAGISYASVFVPYWSTAHLSVGCAGFHRKKSSISPGVQALKNAVVDSCSAVNVAKQSQGTTSHTSVADAPWFAFTYAVQVSLMADRVF